MFVTGSYFFDGTSEKYESVTNIYLAFLQGFVYDVIDFVSRFKKRDRIMTMTQSKRPSMNTMRHSKGSSVNCTSLLFGS